VLNMDKMPVFKNGSEMPWTYYTASIEEDTTNNNEARKRFMYTCESKPSSAGALDQVNMFQRSVNLYQLVQLTVIMKFNTDLLQSKTQLSKIMNHGVGSYKKMPTGNQFYQTMVNFNFNQVVNQVMKICLLLISSSDLVLV